VIWRSISPKQERLAVRLVQFLTEFQVQRQCSQQVGLLPVRIDVLAEPPFSVHPWYKTMSQGLVIGRSFPAMRLWGLFEDKLTPAFAKIWLNTLPVIDPDLGAIIRAELEPLAKRLNRTLEVSA
jgi:hypothetical protein